MVQTLDIPGSELRLYDGTHDASAGLDSESISLLNASPIGSRLWPWVACDPKEWRWIADSCRRPDWSWKFISASAESAIERTMRWPEISRYRACWSAAKHGRRVDVVVTHGPWMTATTETFRQLQRTNGSLHIAFSFNFTVLPQGVRRRLMTKAFQTVDHFFVYSTMEKDLYSEYFGIPRSRFSMVHWGSRDESTDIESLPKQQEPYVSAVGGQGRDYATLSEAMAQLPEIPLSLIATQESVQGIRFPSNVRLRIGVPMEETHQVMQGAKFMLLPLRDNTVPCGHVTSVTSMKLGKATVATRSEGISDYVIDDQTGLICDSRSPNALAKAIRRLWEDEQLCSRLASGAKCFAETYCTEENVADQFRSKVVELVANSRRNGA